MGRGSNLSRLGDFNQTVVFDAIRRTPGGTSRVELVAETGLTAQTVSNIVRRLLAQELIVEGGRVKSAVRGKPRTLLRVEPSARFAVGVHVDPATLTYVLIDIEGKVRQYTRRRTLQSRRPEQVVAAIADQVTQLVTAAGIRPAAVLGLGVAAPGPLDVVEGVDEVFTTLCERGYAGQAACLQLIDEAATALAAGLAVLVNALDVDRVVLGGPIWSRISSRILALLPELIQPQLVAARQPLIVEGSAVGEHVAAQGAAALVLDHFLSPRPSVLLMD